jgi:hypothetical protein
MKELIRHILKEETDDSKTNDFTILKEDLNGVYEMLPEHLVVKNKYGEIKELEPDRFMFK